MNFPKGLVYLSGYFLWLVAFLNNEKQEIIISFSVRKYSYDIAKAKCLECYYCLLHKYKFKPLNISGVIDIVLESDIECKNYNLLDYSSEDIMSLEYLFLYFSPSSYVLHNNTLYKKISRKNQELHKQYDKLFPGQYVHLNTYQTYEITNNDLIDNNIKCANAEMVSNIYNDKLYQDDKNKFISPRNEQNILGTMIYNNQEEYHDVNMDRSLFI